MARIHADRRTAREPSSRGFFPGGPPGSCRRIRRSNQIDQLSMYSRSSRTHTQKIPDIVATADLPQAGQPQPDTQPAAVGQVVETAGFVDRQRAGADEAHFAATR